MARAQALFGFALWARMTVDQIAVLSTLTGMRIGDVRNPSRDSVGQDRISERAFIRLTRGLEEDQWCLEAVGYDPQATDLKAARLLQERLRTELTASAFRWHELNPHQDLRSVSEVAPRSV